MRAVYVPTPVPPRGAAYLVATAVDRESGGTLTRHSTAHPTPCVSMLLTPEQLRQVLRRWAAAHREGHGRLEIED